MTVARFGTKGELLAKHTSLHIGGPAQYYVRVTSERDLIESVGPGHDRGASGPEPGQRLRHQLGRPIARDPDELEIGPSGVGQGTDQVQQGPKRQLAPYRLPAGRRRPRSSWPCRSVFWVSGRRAFCGAGCLWRLWCPPAG